MQNGEKIRGHNVALSSAAESGYTEVPSEEVTLAFFADIELQPHIVGKVVIIGIIKAYS